MPYLQFDLDALKQVPDAARSAGLPEAELGYGLVRTWSYCWQRKTDRVKRAHLAGFFGGTRDSRLPEALEAFGFIERCPNEEDYRIRGAERRLKVAKAQSEAGKRHANNLIPGGPRAEWEPNGSPAPVSALAEDTSRVEPIDTLGSGSALTPSTQHPAPLKPQHQAVVSDSQVGLEDLKPDPDGNYKLTAFGFWGWHEQERTILGLFDEGRPPDQLKKWFDEAAAKVGNENVFRAYRRYLEDGDFAQRGWPIRVFMSEAVWLPRANSPPKKQVRL